MARSHSHACSIIGVCFGGVWLLVLCSIGHLVDASKIGSLSISEAVVKMSSRSQLVLFNPVNVIKDIDQTCVRKNWISVEED